MALPTLTEPTPVCNLSLNGDYVGRCEPMGILPEIYILESKTFGYLFTKCNNIQ